MERGAAARTLDRLVEATEWLAAAALASMVAVVLLGVFYRYVLGAALVWYDEFASYLLVWLSFVGAVVVSHRRRHIGFDLVVQRSPPGVRRVLELAAETCVLAVQLVLLVYGWRLARSMGDETATSLAWVRMTWVYAVLPASGALMALVSLRRMGTLLLRGEEKGGATPWSGSSSE